MIRLKIWQDVIKVIKMVIMSLLTLGILVVELVLLAS